MDIRRIEDALKRHSCLEALAWCSENKTALRKLKVSAPTNSLVFFLGISNNLGSLDRSEHLRI